MKSLILIIGIIILSFGTNNKLYSQGSDFPNDCLVTGCTAVSTTLTFSQYFRVDGCLAEVDFKFLKCGTSPNETYTYIIDGIRVEDCPSGNYDEAEVMKRAKEYLLFIASGYVSNGSSYLPSNLDIEIKAPTCYALIQNGSINEGASTFTTASDCIQDCCSNTYTLNGTGGEVSVSSIVNGMVSNTGCGPNLDCKFVCEEDEIEEGVLDFDNTNSCITSPTAKILFADDFTYSGTNSNFYSLIDFKSGAGSYEVSPRFIYTSDGTDGVVDGPSMAKYVMDIIYHRVSLFGVNANDNMILKIDNCWTNTDGFTYPCVEEDNCCQFIISFSGGIVNIVNYSPASSTCSTPCFDICDDIDDLHNETIVNPKQIFDEEYNLNNKTKLNISPNPSNGITNIKINTEEFGNYQLSLTTLEGYEFLTRDFEIQSNEFNYQLNTKSISNGVYFINIVLNGKSVITRKIIIEN